MQFNPAAKRRATVSSRGGDASPEASAEIHAYIAARDLALRSAERSPTEMSLTRAYLANDLVRNCLKPARSPYQAQSLSATEAARERQRCEVAGGRLAQLRACLKLAA